MSLRDILACPVCRSRVAPAGTDELACTSCERSYPVVEGVPIMLPDPGEASLVHEADLNVRHSYDAWMHRMILQSLGDDQVVVDAGSGNMSLDDPCIVRMDVKLTPHVDLVGDLHALPFRDDSVDYLLSMAVVEHLRQPFEAAEEMWRALKPGGYVYAECNFVFSYHGYPHHYFNASIHGMEQVFRRFTKLRLGIAPFQMPSFALRNVVQTYLLSFEPRSRMEKRFVRALEDLLEHPVEQYDMRFGVDTAFRLAAGSYFVGVKQLTGDERLIPDPVWSVYQEDEELQERFPEPLDLTRPDNLMWWARTEGRERFPAIDRYLRELAPFSKYEDPERPFDRSVVRDMAPVPDFASGPAAGGY